MTAITNYTSLKQTLLDYSKRQDVLDMLDLFIDLCEADIALALRVPEMDTSASGATSTTVRYASLPTRMAEMRQVLITVDDVQLEMDASNINDMRICESAGVPTEYIITSRFEFNRVSDQTYTLTYQFYQNPAPLDSTNSTHTVLTTYPMLYLSGCLRHLFHWAKNTEDAQYWGGVFASELARANWGASRKRHPSGLTIRSHGGMVV